LERWVGLPLRRHRRLGILDITGKRNKGVWEEAAMPETTVNGIRIHYEENGEGAPILCIHGTGSSALIWGDAVERLAELGRVISYDRRGCTRSERPEPYERTSVAEQADDAAGLLESLGAAPAIVIGRSYGGAVAIDLALRRPDLVRALVLLEPADIELSAEASKWTEELIGRVREAVARDGIDAAGEALINEVLGPDGWSTLPGPARDMFTHNSPAILAEMNGEPLDAGAEALAGIDRPALVVAAADSPPEFRDLCDGLVGALPDARFAPVEGGHLIDPASPAVMEFIAGARAYQLRATNEPA
jgi:esterase